MTHRKRNPRADEKEFTVQSLLRKYKYQVFITKRGGTIRCIVAGCRYWQSFVEAREHYRGNRPTGARWSDECIKTAIFNSQGLAIFGEGWIKGARLYAEREDARACLRVLERKVRKYQAKCHRARYG